jgi:hypothetical protein
VLVVTTDRRIHGECMVLGCVRTFMCLPSCFVTVWMDPGVWSVPPPPPARVYRGHAGRCVIWIAPSKMSVRNAARVANRCPDCPLPGETPSQSVKIDRPRTATRDRTSATTASWYPVNNGDVIGGRRALRPSRGSISTSHVKSNRSIAAGRQVDCQVSRPEAEVF